MVKEIEKEKINKLSDELIRISVKLNQEVLDECCKEKQIKELTDKCGNEKIAIFLHKCKLNVNDDYDDHDGYNRYHYIQWIQFNEFKNIEYLAKGGFGEVHKSTWINSYYNGFEMKYYNEDVVLKRIYNNSSDDKIVDILKEVK